MAEAATPPTRPRDAYAPGFVVAVGMLAAVICACFIPAKRVLPAIAGLIAGVTLLPAARLVLPAYGVWVVPLLCLIGGSTIALSVNRPTNLESM